MQADQNVDKNKQRCKNQHLHEDTGVEGCVPYKHRFRRRHRCNDAIAFHKLSYLLSDIQYLDEIVGILGEYVLEAAGQKIVKGLAEEIVQLSFVKMLLHRPYDSTSRYSLGHPFTVLNSINRDFLPVGERFGFVISFTYPA